MKSPKSIVDHYLGEFRAGRCDEAFHSLIETNTDVIPYLIKAYEGSNDAETKVFLIDVISELRFDSTIGFLRHALHLDDPRIWKRALNGLVMTESSAAIDAMNYELLSVVDADKKAWIEEAISDTYSAIKEAQQAAT